MTVQVVISKINAFYICLGFVRCSTAPKAKAVWQSACLFFSVYVKSLTVTFITTAKVVLNCIFDNIYMCTLV